MKRQVPKPSLLILVPSDTSSSVLEMLQNGQRLSKNMKATWLGRLDADLWCKDILWWHYFSRCSSAAFHLPFWYLWFHENVVGGIMLSMHSMTAKSPNTRSFISVDQWDPWQTEVWQSVCPAWYMFSLCGTSLGVAMLLCDLFSFKFAAGNQPRKAHLSLLCIFSCRWHWIHNCQPLQNRFIKHHILLSLFSIYITIIR